MVTTDDLDALLIEADGLIRLDPAFRAGVVVSTDEPLVLRRRLYPRMEALELKLTIRIPPRPLELWLLPARPGPARKENFDAN